MQNTLQDLRYAFRTLLKKPGFTLIATLTLALGIGGCTAIFTVVDAALLRSLPYKSPEQLYHLWERTPQQEFSLREFSYPDYLDYQKNSVFEEIAGYTGGGGILSGNGESERIFSPRATANFFSMLGVEPVVGRTFRAGEDQPGAERVTVLTYGMWQRKFGGAPSVIGQVLSINGDNYTIVGVLPATFQFALRQADLWLPYQPTKSQLTRRFMHGTNVIGRLKQGVRIEQAQAELSVIARRIEQEHKESHAGTGIRLIPLQEQFVGNVRPILWLLLGSVGFVLLIACANVASLLLTRSLSRSKEVAIRTALGASRWRVVQQMLTESILLSVAGGVAGLLIAFWGVQGLVALLPESQLNALPFLRSLGIDLRIVGFSFGLSLLTGVAFGLAPALHASRLDLNDLLKEGGRSSTGGARHRLRSALVIAEIAFAVVLLVGAGLMMRSLLRLLDTDIGFKPQNVLTMTMVMPLAKYREPDAQIAFQQEIKQRIKALPGVKDAGAVDILPLQGGNTTRFYIDGEPVPAPGQETEANIRTVDESYFQTLGIRVISGRTFDDRDGQDAQRVVIIGKTIADRMFPGRDPVGRQIRYTGIESPPELIVGVVADVKITGLDEAIRPVLYSPFRQDPSTATNFVVRTDSAPLSLAGAIRDEVRTLEPQVAVFNVRDMEELIDSAPAAFMRRFPAQIIGIFAGIALLLASIGIYGVVSFSVSQQTRDIGVRMALGAPRSAIMGMILRQGLSVVLPGMAVGVVTAMGLTRLLRSLLFEVQPTDAATFAVVLGTLFVLALLACYLPAHRATRVDPMVALRYE
jgi:putative ABC transport system permease protein